MASNVKQKLRPLVYGLTLTAASLVFLFSFGTLQTKAVTITPPVHFDTLLVASGQTLVADGNAKLGIFPNGLIGPADVVWTARDQGPRLPPATVQQGNWYRMEISGSYTTPGMPRAVALALPYSDSLWSLDVWQYDQTTSTWTKLKTGLNSTTHMAQALPTTLNAWYVVLENRNVERGIASWYCHYHCSSRYPTLHGTSNEFPVGSMVQVRNVANGAAVEVKIVSRWGQPAGRVIDLSWAAFHALKSSNAGLATVTVSPVGAKVLGASTAIGTATTKDESIPALTTSWDGVAAPTAVQARKFSVYDQTTNTILAERGGSDVYPIASISKLMTTMVFLDTQPDMKKVITYSTANNAHCSCLYLNQGETLTVRDLFFATLVGSANNAANALVGSTGLSKEEFVTRMNAKAATLGLTHTHFNEPTGLDPANVSTATEVAKMAAFALHNYEPIRYATTRLSYTFNTINTAKTHTIYLRYSMYGRTLPLTGLTISGGKTGYLDESLNNYALRIKNTQGAQVVFVVFGSPTNAQRLNDEWALVNWAFGHYTWQ